MHRIITFLLMKSLVNQKSVIVRNNRLTLHKIQTIKEEIAQELNIDRDNNIHRVTQYEDTNNTRNCTVKDTTIQHNQTHNHNQPRMFRKKHLVPCTEV